MSIFFGSRDRFTVSQKTKKTYDLIVTKRKLLRSHGQLFAYAASCGLAAGERTKLKSKEDLAIMSGLKTKDYDYESLFGVIISHLHPDASPDERLQILQEYAEFGIIKIRLHFDKYGRFSFQRLFQDLSGSESTRE